MTRREAAEQAKKQTTPAAEDACVLCGYWRCRCAEMAKGTR
ncbi:hypothetical protein NKH77_56140 [Streptomyces sp. M19]